MTWELRPTQRRVEELNIAPLLDMVFILLIFFMATTTFVRDTMVDLERPGARSAAPSADRAVRVAVGYQGALLIDAMPVTPWMLQARVHEALARGSWDTVLVIADRRVDTGRLVEVVDQCRLAGAAHVGVAVEEKP